MKIFQLIQKPQLRGAEIFACQLSKALTKKGHTCIIVTLFQGDAVLPFDGKVIHLGLSKKIRFIDWRGWKKLADLIKSENPDVLQANAGDTLKYAVISKLLFGWKVPIVFRNASTVSLYIKNPWIKRWNAFLYGVTDYIISVSEYTRNDFLSVFPFASTKIGVIPIGIEPDDFQGNKKSEIDIPILLHVGGFTFEKNHTGLIRIVEQVNIRYPNVVLWLVGDGPLRSNVEQFVQSKSMTDKVRFWGYQANPAEFFRQATLFLLPSIIEGLPGVILESFYCKIPVVAYHVGAIGELIKTDETGFLIEKGNEKDFVTVVVKALQDKSGLSAYVENAYQLVTENYTLSSVSDRFESMYRKLVE